MPKEDLCSPLSSPSTWYVRERSLLPHTWLSALVHLLSLSTADEARNNKLVVQFMKRTLHARSRKAQGGGQVSGPGPLVDHGRAFLRLG